MTRLSKIVLRMLLVLVMPLAAHGQDAAPPPSYSQEQIDQMVAPIALYPDQLVGQILMASTYPLEIVEANRWLQDPENAGLQGDTLAQVLMQQPWDPSVKSLVAFPQILGTLNSNLQWTEQLGDAFLGQQPQVMDSVQRLRQMAITSGHLASTPQQLVESQNGFITVQPAYPGVVYVPYYNPVVVYGAWPYPGYRPYYFHPYPGVVYGAGGFLGFGVGVAVIGEFWGWNSWDWRNHRLDIDNGRFAAINRGQPPHFSGTWEHDPAHRYGVPYASPAVRAHFQGAGAQQSHQGFRGYASQPQGREFITPTPAPSRATQSFQTTRPSPSAVPQVRTENRPQPHASPVFESFSHGDEVREQSARGASSRATIQAQPRAQPAPHPSPSAHNAPPAARGNDNHQDNIRGR